jgi:hypothetical protein
VVPRNHLVTGSLRRYHRFLGDDHTVEYPAGTGRQCTLGEVADDLGRRLVSLFLADDDGRRPGWGEAAGWHLADPARRDLVPFFEYFHGDTGAGLGAAHQTGWTGLVSTSCWGLTSVLVSEIL